MARKGKSTEEIIGFLLNGSHIIPRLEHLQDLGVIQGVAPTADRRLAILDQHPASRRRDKPLER
jgi:hypothetical protein